MVKFGEVSEDIIKVVEDFLEKETCSSCGSKFGGESELEWGWKPKLPQNLNLKIKCTKCANIKKTNLKIQP